MRYSYDDYVAQRLTRFAPAIALLAVTAAVMVCLMAAVATAGTAQAPWRLAIRNAAVTHGDMVVLGDIASPVGELPDAQWRSLSTVQLWRAPEGKGNQVVLSNRELRRVLRSRLGSDIASMCVIPASLAVQQGGRVIAGPDLERLVVEHLTPRVSSMRGDVKLRDFRLPSHVFLSDAASSLEVLVAGTFKPGRLSLRLREVDINGTQRRKYTGTVFMDQWLTVPCAARPINPRNGLTPGAVTYMSKNVAYLRGEPWDGKTFGVRVRRPVGAGEVIYAENLEDIPLISRGDKVTLEFRGKYVRLSVAAEAMADGKLGERIPVRNLQSEREILADVRDSQTVVVP